MANVDNAWTLCKLYGCQVYAKEGEVAAAKAENAELVTLSFSRDQSSSALTMSQNEARPMYVLSNYHWPLPEKDLEQEAQRIAEAVLKVLRDNGDNLAVLAAIRRALVEK